MATSNSVLQFSVFLLVCIISSVLSQVPKQKQFQYVNYGDLGEVSVDYAADYRPVGISSFPFSLCLYNTTPNAFVLGIRMGSRTTESIMKWVWEANRPNPVRDNATLTFSGDGNLVLMDSDKRIAWQTNTANKGVVDLKLLTNGNLVLLDKKKKFVWQSFDYPSDVLLPGQILRPGGAIKLVSRKSQEDPSEGPYSMVLEKSRLVLYKKTPTKPLVYYSFSDFIQFYPEPSGTIAYITFTASSASNSGPTEISLTYQVLNSGTSGTQILARPLFNATLAFLRMEMDGNLKVHTFAQEVDHLSWDTPFTLFDRSNSMSDECHLPNKCGTFGLCEHNQCVGCPTAKGIAGWNSACAPPKLPSCKKEKTRSFKYYKVVGVDHYSTEYEDGEAISVDMCKKKCDVDCDCVGFFYKEQELKCLRVPVLDTLIKVSNTTHVAYIKT